MQLPMPVFELCCIIKIGISINRRIIPHFPKVFFYRWRIKVLPNQAFAKGYPFLIRQRRKWLKISFKKQFFVSPAMQQTIVSQLGSPSDLKERYMVSCYSKFNGYCYRIPLSTVGWTLHDKKCALFIMLIYQNVVKTLSLHRIVDLCKMPSVEQSWNGHRYS